MGVVLPERTCEDFLQSRECSSEASAGSPCFELSSYWTDADVSDGRPSSLTRGYGGGPTHLVLFEAAGLASPLHGALMR